MTRAYASDPHVPYLVSFILTRDEIDRLTDIADTEMADAVTWDLVIRIKSAWPAERDQHMLAPAPVTSLTTEV